MATVGGVAGGITEAEDEETTAESAGTDDADETVTGTAAGTFAEVNTVAEEAASEKSGTATPHSPAYHFLAFDAPGSPAATASPNATTASTPQKHAISIA